MRSPYDPKPSIVRSPEERAEIRKQIARRASVGNSGADVKLDSHGPVKSLNEFDALLTQTADDLHELLQRINERSKRNA
jgi:hypothetical protein